MKPHTPLLTASWSTSPVVGAWCVMAMLTGIATGQNPTKEKSSDDANLAGRPCPHVVVEGQMTDLIGSGLAGAEVVARRKTNDGTEGPLLGRAKTDNFGDFQVCSDRPVMAKAGLPPAEIVVTVSKASYAILTREFTLDDAEFPPYLAEALGGDVGVTGRVIRFDSEAPIKGASILLSAVDQDWTAESDADGRFSIKGVPPGQGVITASAPGFGRERQMITRLADAREIELALEVGRTVKLIVRDDLGKPIPGVLVECFGEEQDDFRTAETDAKGTVTLDGFHVDTGALDIKLTHEAHVSDEAFDRSIHLSDKKTNPEHVLVMPRAGKISGMVTDAATGQPLNGARVATGILDSYSSPRDWSNYRGRYSVMGVAPGQTIVTVHLADYAPELSTVSVKPGATATLDFKMKPAAQVRGTVKNKDGEPVPSAYVDASRWRGYETLGLRSVTAEDGRFVIENAPPDEFEVTVSARGMKNVKVMVKAGAEPIDIVVEIDPSAPGGRPVAKVKVGDAVPPLTLTALDGTKLDLAKLEGKTVLLDFWATWCSPCVADLPHMADIYKEFGSRKDFAMIGISLDYDEKSLTDFVKKRNLGWHQVYGDAGGSEAAADAFGVVGIPAVFIIDATGKIVATDLMASEVHDRVKKALGKSDTP